MGRKKLWIEAMVAKFRGGTIARIDAVLAPLEKRTDFIREAVEKELTERESK